MNRRIVLVATGGAVALVLLTVWALAADDDGSGAAQAQSPTTTPATSAGARTVTVDGVGSVSGVADTATVSLGVRIEAPTATEALETAGAKVQTIVDTLTDAGVAKSDIRTTAVSVYPDYRNADRPTGYWADDSVQATIHDVAKAGPVLDATTRAVGDGITLSGVAFSVDDTSALHAKARESAVTDARTRAGQLAAAAGGSVGAVLSIHESPPYGPSVFDAAAGSSAPTTVAGPAVEPGHENLQLTVQVVFALLA